MTRVIDSIIIHCSDSEWGNMAVIDDWHSQRGWDGIGYHAVICNGIWDSGGEYFYDLDGVIEPGREVKKTGAHARGHNKTSLGICLIGKKNFTHKQMVALEKLVTVWTSLYGIPDDCVFGHNEFSKKTCPNFNVPKWWTGQDR